MSTIELQELVMKAMSLAPDGRARLAELLIQSLEETDDPEIKAAWVSGIRRRDQQIRSGQKVTRPANRCSRRRESSCDVRSRIPRRRCLFGKIA